MNVYFEYFLKYFMSFTLFVVTILIIYAWIIEIIFYRKNNWNWSRKPEKTFLIYTDDPTSKKNDIGGFGRVLFVYPVMLIIFLFFSIVFSGIFDIKIGSTGMAHLAPVKAISCATAEIMCETPNGW